MFSITYEVYNHNTSFAAYDYPAINATEDFFAGGFSLPVYFHLLAHSDGVVEQREGFVLFLEIQESKLDPRDVGNVSLSRSAYLVRINDTGLSRITNHLYYDEANPMCSRNLIHPRVYDSTP